MSKRTKVTDAGDLAYWAILYNSNTRSARSRRWYYIARVIRVDGEWYELFRSNYTGNNCADLRKRGQAQGYNLLPGLFTPPPSPRLANRLLWSLDHS